MNNTYFLLLGWFLLGLLSTTTHVKSALQNGQPLLGTFIQMLIGSIVSFSILRTRNISIGFDYKSYLPIAFVHYVVNLINNYGILQDSSSTQILKSLEPISTMILTRYLLQEQPSRLAEICVLPLIIGVILLSYNHAHITASLLLLVLASNFMLSYRNVSIKNMINTVQISDSVTVIYRVCSIATIMALPPLVFESNLSILTQDLWASSIYHFLYDSFSLLLLFYISVLSVSVGNVMNNALVIIVSTLYLHTRVQFYGIALCVTGSLLYIYITNKSNTDNNNNSSSRSIKLVYLVVGLSLLGLLTQFSPNKLIYNNNNLTITATYTTAPNPHTLSTPTTITTPTTTVTPEESTEPTSTKSPEEQPQTDTDTSTTGEVLSFMLIWTRAEYEFPPRLEKCIESILFHHPKSIVTLYTSHLEGQEPLTRLRNEYTDQINVKLIDVHDIFSDTPLRKWGRFHRYWKIRCMQNFDYHLVDALRLALLWKMGGIIVDADMIFTQPILWTDNVISLYNGQVSTKILKFEEENPFISDCMSYFAQNFDPSQKEANGKKVLEAVLKDCTFDCDRVEQINIATLPLSIDTAYDVTDAWNDVKLNQSIAIDIQYWDIANKTIKSGSFVHKIITSNTFDTLPNYIDSLNINSLMKFGAYNYDTRNVGDEIQSIASIQYLPRVDYFINRDYPTNSSHLPNITLIANGWYAHNKQWELPQNIHPIMVSFHGTLKFPYETLAPWFKQFAPIGCRDKYTLRRFQAVGVDAYFSGCVTTTMQNIYDDLPMTDNIYFVDAQATVLPKRIVSKMINLTHETPVEQESKYFEKFEIAENNLGKYARAKLVMSNRIHVCLPSLGMRTPVIFLVNASETFTDPEQVYSISPRWPGLLDLFTVFQNYTPPEVVNAYDFDNPPPNRPHDDMKQGIWKHLQRSPYIRESGRMFGMYK